MANETTTTTVNDLVPSIIVEAMFQAQERSLMAGLVKNYNLPFGSGKTIDVPVYDAVSAAAVAEGTDLENTAVSTGVATLTVGEVGIMTTVTDMARDISTQNVIADVGYMFGNAIATAQDKALCALFAALNGGTVVGGATVTATPAHLFQAIATLRARSIDAQDCAIVLHPEVAYDIKSVITSTFAAPASEMGNTAMRNGWIGTLGGVPVYESANIVSTTGDSIGAIFHRDALGLATLRGIQIEPQRDASLRATELVATAVYGTGELRDQFGIPLSFDSTLVDA